MAKKMSIRRLQKRVQTRRGAVVRSRHGQRRPEKLGCRHWTTMYDGRSVAADDDAEQRRPQALRNSSARYDGAVPCRPLNVRTASLKWILAVVLIQWSLWRSGETELHFDDENTSLAAEFITDWSRRSRNDGMRDSVELPHAVQPWHDQGRH